MALMTSEEVKAIRDANGGEDNTEHVRGPKDAWEVILRRPLRKEYKAFRSFANDPRSKADAQEYLVKACAVYPPKEKVESFLDQFYAVPEDPKVQAALKRLMDVNTDGGLIDEEGK